MLTRVKDLKSMEIHTKDGDIGKVSDVFFDDEKWVVRYLVVNTGGWMMKQEVLLSPIAVKNLDFKNGKIEVNLTREQVENSPDVETDRPVSRLQEMKYHMHYGWGSYWGGVGLWGNEMYPAALSDPRLNRGTKWEEEQNEKYQGDRDMVTPEGSEKLEEKTHLRSSSQVGGYHIEAPDGEIGHVHDYLIDPESWVINWIEIGTRNWLPGKHVLISPQWVESIDWATAQMHVRVPREKIKNAPPYDKENGMTKKFHQELTDYYQEFFVTKPESR